MKSKSTLSCIFFGLLAVIETSSCAKKTAPKAAPAASKSSSAAATDGSSSDQCVSTDGAALALAQFPRRDKITSMSQLPSVTGQLSVDEFLGFNQLKTSVSVQDPKNYDYTAYLKVLRNLVTGQAQVSMSVEKEEIMPQAPGSYTLEVRACLDEPLVSEAAVLEFRKQGQATDTVYYKDSFGKGFYCGAKFTTTPFMMPDIAKAQELYAAHLGDIKNAKNQGLLLGEELCSRIIELERNKQSYAYMLEDEGLQGCALDLFYNAGDIVAQGEDTVAQIQAAATKNPKSFQLTDSTSGCVSSSSVDAVSNILSGDGSATSAYDPSSSDYSSDPYAGDTSGATTDPTTAVAADGSAAPADTSSTSTDPLASGAAGVVGQMVAGATGASGDSGSSASGGSTYMKSLGVGIGVGLLLTVVGAVGIYGANKYIKNGAADNLNRRLTAESDFTKKITILEKFKARFPSSEKFVAGFDEVMSKVDMEGVDDTQKLNNKATELRRMYELAAPNASKMADVRGKMVELANTISATSGSGTSSYSSSTHSLIDDDLQKFKLALGVPLETELTTLKEADLGGAKINSKLDASSHATRVKDSLGRVTGFTDIKTGEGFKAKSLGIGKGLAVGAIAAGILVGIVGMSGGLGLTATQPTDPIGTDPAVNDLLTKILALKKNFDDLKAKAGDELVNLQNPSAVSP